MNAGRIGWGGRELRMWDAATDAAGAFCGLLISMVLEKIIFKIFSIHLKLLV